MSDLENEEIEERAVANVGGSYEDELAQFAIDLEQMEEEVSISEDLTGFAKGFPDWDLHPPKK